MLPALDRYLRDISLKDVSKNSSNIMLCLIMKKTIICNFLILLLQFAFLTNALADDYEKPVLQTITIGLIIDGSINRETDRKSSPLMVFINELKTLTKGEFKLYFPESKQVNGQWSRKQISKGLQSLQDDTEVDMILALGWMASQIAATSPELRKPTFAPFIPNTRVMGVKREGNASGVENLSFLSTEMHFEDELNAFLKVIPFTQLSILIDSANYNFFSGSFKRLKKNAQQKGVEIHFIQHKNTSEDLLAKIPADTQAVMITLLPKLNNESKKALVEGLITKQLPSFNWMSNVTVAEGLLMSTRPLSWQRLARRNAFNMQAVMRGNKASEQPVLIENKPQLTINMATARAIKLSPGFDILNTANLINENAEPDSATMNLSSIAKLAIQANLNIVAGKTGLKANAQNITEARSILFPKITANMTYFQANADNPFVEIGLSPEKRTQGTIRLEQALFSERALAYLEVQKQLHIARKEQQRTLELDIVQQATKTFLNILIAQTHTDILQNNLKLSKAHLNQAKIRVQAGTANLSDVYRWESEIARVRQQVLIAKSKLEQAKDVLNLILHRPIQQRYKLQPTALNDPSLLISHKALLNIITNKKDLERMGQFFVKEGLQSSPELATLKAQINAQARHVDSEKRSYWSPNIGLFGEVSEVYNETINSGLPGLSITLEDQTMWQAGINMSLPLFEGGARHARITRSELDLQQLNTQQQFAQDKIEQVIRQRLHAMNASYPAIKLSKESAEAAHKSYRIVNDNYVNGTLSVTNLLDAQTANLVAEQSAANAVYAFLIDLMNLQRSVGQFDFFLNDSQSAQKAERLKSFISNEG